MTRRRAFTIIELVMVLMIISISLAVAAPSLRGWGEQGRLRDAAGSFAAAATWARSRAVADAVTYRVVVDPVAGTYAVQNVTAQQATAVKGEFGQANKLPEGFRITVEAQPTQTAGAAPANAIEFYPDGRTTPATVRITSKTGNVIDVASAGPAESFAVVKAVSQK
ncbi:MAG TPA: GspH/FimT family pseudopilin [Tepidisphaeraceae bacterium]|jgi:type II secretion system protein H